MPKQYRVCGRLVPRFGARRMILPLALFSLLAVALIVSLVAPSSSAASLAAAKELASQYDPHKISVSVSDVSDSIASSRLNPFRQSSHKPPPRQKNDEYKGTSWWADWKWLSMPFSSSFTHDEDRAVLPPLVERPPIYCYYDATAQKPRDEKDAESELLLTWRRAWWAQGFRPIILSASEAMDNPTYREVQARGSGDGEGTNTGALMPDLKAELMRWLAWENMGGGLLSRYTLLPMGPRDDPVLSYLRRGEYPELTGWTDLGTGLFAGGQPEIHAAIKAVLSPTTDAQRQPHAKDSASNILNALPGGMLSIDKTPSALAFYSDDAIKKTFKKVAEANGQGKAKGLETLNKLINAHLQLSWQDRFPEGIEVLKPFPRHATAMVASAMDLAEALAVCPPSPMPSTCPPNQRRCKTCTPGPNGSPPMKITTPAVYHNSTRAFTIGTVPHPWTLAVTDNLRDDFNATWIRLESQRDSWVTQVMRELPKGDVSSHARVMRFKEAVAGETSVGRSLWLTAETDMPKDMGWTFGFAVPERPTSSEWEEHHRQQQHHSDGEGNEDEDEGSLTQEMYLLSGAREVVAQTKPTAKTRLRASLEAWNLADHEAWKFARAFQARRTMVRSDWEKEEAKYSRGSGTEGGRSSWNRWGDKKEDGEPSTEQGK